jgi:hypothetical protein
MSTRIAAYKMNPAEDRILYGDEITEGMWVMFEDPHGRCSDEAPEDEQIRSNRFCRVTRMRTTNNGQTIVFIGEWVDGYQKRYATHGNASWIVKREDAPPAEVELREIAGEDK